MCSFTCAVLKIAAVFRTRGRAQGRPSTGSSYRRRVRALRGAIKPLRCLDDRCVAANDAETVLSGQDDRSCLAAARRVPGQRLEGNSAADRYPWTMTITLPPALAVFRRQDWPVSLGARPAASSNSAAIRPRPTGTRARGNRLGRSRRVDRR